MTKMNHIKEEHSRTRTIPGTWYLTSYKYKYNVSHLQPFLEKLKEKKIIGLKCQGCNTVSFPPKLVCGKCLIKPRQWVSLRDTATIATYTIIYSKDKDGKKISKPSVAIRQDGSDTTYTGKLSPEINFEDCYIGMPVKVHWAENPKGGLPDIEYYELIEDPTKDMELRKD